MTSGCKPSRETTPKDGTLPRLENDRPMNLMNRLMICCVAFVLALGGAASAADKTLIDYFLPMPIRGALTTNAWGAANVLPRDVSNGLEDASMKKWNYWDGQIIKAPDGKFHL